MRFSFLRRSAWLALALGVMVSCSPTINPPPYYPPQQQYQVQDAPKPPPRQEQPAQTWTAQPPASARTVRVALLLPLSGDAAKLGQSMLDAAMLALKDKYDTLRGADAGRVNVVLIPKDTKGNAAGAVTAAQEALAQNAELILGPLFSQHVSAVAPVARAKGVNVISFSNNKSVAGNGVYIMGFLPEQQVHRVVTYALSTGLKNIGALLPNDVYGTTVADELRKVTFSSKGMLLGTEFYPPDAADISPQIRKLAGFENVDLEFRRNKQVYKSFGEYPNADIEPAPEFDALLIPEGGQRLLSIVERLPYFEIDPGKVRLLGSGQWDDPIVTRSPGLVGAWFAGANPRGRESFERHFYEKYGYKPERLASLAYDSTALAITLAFAPQGPDFSARALTNRAGFYGPVDGIFRFYESGISERGLAVLEVTPRGFNVIDPMPTAFK